MDLNFASRDHPPVQDFDDDDSAQAADPSEVAGSPVQVENEPSDEDMGSADPPAP